MKKKNIFRTLILLLGALPLVFAGCEEQDTYMEPGVVDMNDRITSVDKEIAQPGDIVTFTGTNLDKVYKIMLNTDNVPVSFQATATELKMTVPGTSPLGDVITINILFSGKGLAQRVIKIISPPVIQEFSPSAAQPGSVITLYGRELYLAQKIYVGDLEAASIEIIDDRIIRFPMPAGSTGGAIKVVTATGGESFGPRDLALGTEILVNNFDATSSYYSSISANGNLKNPEYLTGDFPRNKFVMLTITDAGTGWGGNVDFFLQNLPVADNSKISLSVDVKVSKAMNVNIMVQGPANVYGKTLGMTTEWQTIVLPFSEMGTGYGGGEPIGAVEAFNTLTAVKLQPPAQAANGNFGETISIDNIKFIIEN
ncbi:MAG: IPT/TIG domain-containing protein [Tenuifilaceae bacterium]|nr:IPT/TIG domain-containing protein [Tenuifilaceae bacterium]